ncbi:MAG: hypothetical protein LBV72_00970 [Tannerella sp.]|jgi:hypothetical protein|nr:hypothetical protein [Tannerella sp.]
MNKTKVIEKVSCLSGIDTINCEKVIDALEHVLNDELISSGELGNSLNEIYKIISLFRNA